MNLVVGRVTTPPNSVIPLVPAEQTPDGLPP
jgi:hypothetical protein